MCYIWNVHRRGQAVSSYPRCIMRAGNRSQVVLPGGPSPGAGFIKGIAAFIRMPPPDAGGGERKANRLPWGGKEPRLYASVMLNGERQQCKRGRNPPDAPGLSDGFFHRVNLLSMGRGVGTAPVKPVRMSMTAALILSRRYWIWEPACRPIC